MQALDFGIFLFFTLGVVLFGCTFYRRGATANDFVKASQSLPGWIVGMSIFATYVSSISYIGYPGKAFAADWNAFVFSLSIPIASWAAARWFVPFYRRHGSASAYTFLEERFGRWARLYASACYLLTQIARMGSILYLLAVPMYILMGWDIHLVIIVTSLAVIVFSVLGGIRAVIWTDAVYGFLLIGGALLCLCLLAWRMPGGPSQLFDLAIHSPQGNKFSLGEFSADLTSSTFWVCLIYGIFINLQNYGIDQNYVQRYHTAKTDRDARFSALFGGWLFIPVSAIFFLIGTALYSYYTASPQLLPAEITAKPDYVFPFFIVHELPVGLRGLLIASIFAAGMSTVSTSVTSAATVLLTDYHNPFFPLASERRQVIFLRTSCIVIGLLGCIVAIAMLSVVSIIDAWWTLSSIFSGGMLGLFLLGIIPSKIGRIPALIGCLCGVAVIAWISLSSTLNLPGIHLHNYMAIVLGTTAIFITGFLCSKAI